DPLALVEGFCSREGKIRPGHAGLILIDMPRTVASEKRGPDAGPNRQPVIQIQMMTDISKADQSVFCIQPDRINVRISARLAFPRINPVLLHAKSNFSSIFFIKAQRSVSLRGHVTDT